MWQPPTSGCHQEEIWLVGPQLKHLACLVNLSQLILAASSLPQDNLMMNSGSFWSFVESFLSVAYISLNITHPGFMQMSCVRDLAIQATAAPDECLRTQHNARQPEHLTSSAFPWPRYCPSWALSRAALFFRRNAAADSGLS